MTQPVTRIAKDQVVAVIPARYQSSRFPGKPLALLAGRPLVSHVVAMALKAKRVGQVIVASDHVEIARAAREAGALAVLTREDHASGSDRIGEVIQAREETVVLNIQGDEPLIPPSAIDRLVELLEENPEAAVSSLASPLARFSEDYFDPNVVKVVRDARGFALYFSRAPIPGHRADQAAGPSPSGEDALRHVGLYGFRRQALLDFLGRAPGRLEKAENLEQLRFLENGERIIVGVIEAIPPGVDTPRDLERIQGRFTANEGHGGDPSAGSSPPGKDGVGSG